VDKNPLISKLNKAVPGAVLETRRFGRSGTTSIWIEAQTIQKVAHALRNDSELKLDWLENLSVVEFEGILVVTYFVRSTTSQFYYVIRASAVPASPDAEVLFPSIRGIWPMGVSMEQEAEEMFGVRFRANEESSSEGPAKPGRLPEDWKGFPLRKNYVFPKEFFGVTHSRPFNSSTQKKTQT
jgi:NADH:ubiquinone oxidoreductase subunit C